ncbi:MAG: hypothetical protein AABZ25_03700, partial [Nitrospirota bacterium]
TNIVYKSSLEQTGVIIFCPVLSRSISNCHDVAGVIRNVKPYYVVSLYRIFSLLKFLRLKGYD